MEGASPDPSVCGLSSTENISNFINIDVETALRELADGHPAAPSPTAGPTPAEPDSEQDMSPADAAVVAGDQADVPPSDLEVPADDEAPSGESSDSDVIHIDLTQRPPPLPMSGLSLEQIVSMLPGTTYSVAGSGVPLRTSPRPEEPRQQSPSSKAKAASTSGVEDQPLAPGSGSEGGSPSSSSDSADGADGQPSPERPAAQAPKQAGRGAGGGGGGSPRVAFTFIPGLGLVPVVIDDDDEDDGDAMEEDEDDDDVDQGSEAADSQGMRTGCIVIEAHSDGNADGEEGGGADIGNDVYDDDDGDDADLDLDDGVEALAAAFSAQYDMGRDEEGGKPSSAEGTTTAAGGVAVADHRPGSAGGSAGSRAVDGIDLDEAAADDSGIDVPAVDEGASSSGRDTELGLNLGAGEPLEGEAPPNQQYDISEEQLRNIIQQAVHGLEFGGLEGRADAPDGEGDDEGEDEGDAEQEDGEDEDERVLRDVQKQLGAQDFSGEEDSPSPGSGSPAAPEQPTAADTSDEPEPADLGSHRSLTALYAPETGEDSNGARAPGHGDPRDSDEFAEDEIDYGEDALIDVDEEGLGMGGDEVDDSGSGAGDEPDSILGGLRRLSHAADGSSSLAGPGADACHAPELGSLGAGAGVGGPVKIWPTLGTGTVLAPVRSQSGSDDAHVMASRLAPQPAVPGPNQLPRPRYMMYNMYRSYDAIHFGSSEEDGDGAAGKGSQAELRGGAAGDRAAEADREGLQDERVEGDPPAPDSATEARGKVAPQLLSAASPSLGSIGRSLSAGHATSGGGVGGGNLNATLRGTGQSLSAIRQAALQAEAERQAKFMAERLGGGADKDTHTSVAKPDPAQAEANGARKQAQAQHHHHQAGSSTSTTSSLPPIPGAKPVGNHITNPFGYAGLEASAAAGLIDISLDGDGVSGAQRNARRAAGGSGAPCWPGTQSRGCSGYGDGSEQGGADVEDLEDLLRDRPIIQPRYPTDAKPAADHQEKQPHQHHHHHHHHHHDHQHHQHHQHHHHHRDGHVTQSGGVGDEDGPEGDAGREGGAADDGAGGSWRPRHRRSVELVDLDRLTGPDGEELPLGSSPKGDDRQGSAEDKPPSSPPSRSLLATRKSDDGMLAPPASSWSPRMEEEQGGGHSTSTSSGSTSSAHSVADEHLVGELEAMREELSQKTTLVAGLRGELRKYTELAMRLEHQLGELRHQVDGDVGSKAAGRLRSQSEAGMRSSPARASELLPPAAAAPGQRELPGPSEPDTPQQQQQPQSSAPQPPTPSREQQQQQQPSGPSAPASAGPGPVSHGLPPHPQAQGLEGPARLTLYREILSQAQLHVGRSAGPSPPDLRDAQDLLVGKDKLDAGTEKVMLIKLQKLVAWGCEAAFKASAAQQQARMMEHAAQQAAQKANALEAEQKRLKQELEAALAGPASAGTGAGSGGARPAGKQESGGLRTQLEVAQGELAVSRAQVSDLECAVASLNADVRKLKVQLRSSLDGASQSSQLEAGGRSGAADSASRADNVGWNMERQMLLRTITSLEQELEQARAAAPAGPRLRRSSGSSSSGGDIGSPGAGDAVAKKAALADAALERVQELQDERDAAVAEAAELRRRLQREGDAGSVGLGARGGVGAASGAGSSLEEVERLRRELAAARAALERAAADSEAQAAAHEEQCAVLRGQVVELRRELADGAMDAAGAQGRLEVAQAQSEALVGKLERQVAMAEREAQRLRAALAEQTAARAALEQQLQALGTGTQASELSAVVEAKSRSASSDTKERVEALQAELRDQSAEATATIQALQQALKIASTDRDRLQQLLDAKGRDLAQAEAQLGDVRNAVSQLQAEAAELHAQVAQLQSVLARAQRERDDAEAKATAAEESACDAHAASLLAETALGRALEEVEALTRRLGTLEDEAEKAGEDAARLRARLEAAEAEARKAKAESDELRAYAAELETEARDLRTALDAEDNVQVQLRGQVECLTTELEAQASVAQMRERRATEAEGEGLTAAVEAEEARAEAEAARQDAAEAEARLAEAQAKLAAAVRRGDEAVRKVGDLQQQLEEETSQRQQLELRLQETLAQLEAVAVQRSPGAEARRRAQAAEAATSALDVGKALAEARLVALEEQLRAAEVDREAMRQEVSALLKQLGSSTQQQLQMAAAGPLALQDQPPTGPVQGVEEGAESGGAGGEAAALRAERALLLADCARLQAELEGLRTSDVGGAIAAPTPTWRLRSAAGAAAARAEADALHEQLQVTQAELQATRGELKAARAELAAKGELLTAKDRALNMLQDTVETLRVALQVTQQSLLLPASSPKSPFGPGAEGPYAAERQQQYQDTVAALQGKFQESESTIKRLEKQMAALETRLTPEDKRDAGPAAAPSPTGARAAQRDKSALPQEQQPQQPSSGSDPAIQGLRAQLEEKRDENARLLNDLEQARRQLLTATRPPSDGPSSSGRSSVPRGAAASSGVAVEASSGASAATVNDLQMQLLQWRALGEDIQARYQSKKETVRRLREQLVAEQQRHADEQARGKAQLEAACQRLGRLAAELGAALRRCIALDLQPLSATTLTTSPRSQLGGGDMPEDINALAALLARQGSALIESLELALDHVTSAREERGLLLAQLAHRQVVLDELRHHIARQAMAAPAPTGANIGAAAALAAGAPATSLAATPGAWASPAPLQTGAYTASRTPSAAAAPPEASPKATPASASTAAAASSPSKSLHAAAMNLAQDMAALSAQQAGLRSTLHQLEQRQAAAPAPAQQQQQPQQLLLQVKSRSQISVPYTPGAAGYMGLSGAAGTAAASVRMPPRFGSGGVPTAGESVALGASAGAGGGLVSPLVGVGRLATGRPEAVTPVGGAPLTRPLVGGLYQPQPTSPAVGAVASPQYDAGLQTSSYLQGSRGAGGMGAGALGIGAGAADGAAAVLGAGAGVGLAPAAPAGVGIGGPGTTLRLSQERRIRLGEVAP